MAREPRAAGTGVCSRETDMRDAARAPDFSKKDTMTPQERLAALAAGEPTDRVPFNPFSSGFSARMRGMDLGVYYRNPDKAFQAGFDLMRRYPWMNTRPTYGWADRGAWEFGGKIVWPDGNRYQTPVCPEPVIHDPREVDTLPDPDPETAGINPLLDRFNQVCRRHGFPASLPGGTPTSLSAGVVGRSTFLKWLVKYPEAVHRLQRKVNDFLLRSAEKTIKAYGAENCALFLSVPMESNQLISPSAFGNFCKPYIRELMRYYVSEGVRSVMLHLCGDHTANLPLWSDIPLPPRTIVSIGHEMDLEETGGTIGAGHILAGNINTSAFQTGTPQTVMEEVARSLETGMKHPGGFLLMPACELPPLTPLENMEALARALYERGYYQ